MSLVQKVFLAHLLVSVLILAVGYALTGHWIIALILLLLGGLWFAAQLRHAAGIGSLMLFLLLPACAVGMWLGIPGWLALASAVSALGAWDLDHFLIRLSTAQRVELSAGLGSAHLRRLFQVEGIGLLAGLAALGASLVRTRLPFWWEVLLVILAVIGISRLVGLVRKQVED